MFDESVWNKKIYKMFFFFFSDFYWGFSAIDTLVNNAFAQLMVLLEKRLRILILPIGLSIGGVFFCLNSMRHWSEQNIINWTSNWNLIESFQTSLAYHCALNLLRAKQRIFNLWLHIKIGTFYLSILCIFDIDSESGIYLWQSHVVFEL